MIKTEDGWTYLEWALALMVFSLLIGLMHPLLTVFFSSNSEKQRHGQALWLAQEAMERQIGNTGGHPWQGEETIRLDRQAFDIRWRRETVSEGLERVEVIAAWQISRTPRELRLERHLFRP